MNNGLQDQLRAFKLVFGVPAAFLLIVSVSLLPIAR